MDNKENQEINAGSMADIAFLLLIFFLVTTTMDQEKGIRRVLPILKGESGIVIERNVFEVLVNDSDKLLVEKEEIQIELLKDRTMAYLTNSGVFNNDEEDINLPKRTWVKTDSIRTRIASIKYKALEVNTDLKDKDDLNILAAKLDAVNFFGQYKELPKSAIISLQNHDGTSYGMYVQVQNELASALNELRDQITLKKFGKTYLALDQRDPFDRRIIKAVRQIYPQRISEDQSKK